MRSRCASGCGGSDDLGVLSVPFRLMFFGMSIVRQSNAGISGGHVPQRLQSVCVLLWRFPKLEVPFAVSRSVSKCG
jgi:hypothetical protein